MFRNILVPVNLSDWGRLVVKAAADLVAPENGRLSLLHVIEEVEGLSGDEAESFYRSLRERAEQVLQERVRELGRPPCELQREVLVGRRAATIVRRADELGCDLIVMGAHAIDPEAPTRAMWTTSQKVALLASVPVLLMR
jgi:nucleotide-binding universal stress UspA family protein